MDNNVQKVVTEIAVTTAKDVYDDAIKPSAKNIGGFFGTLTAFFDKVVLYPLKILNAKYEQKAIAFQREMEEKYNGIPEEHRCEPKLSIVGPAMESLKYNLTEDDISEMFKNLLVNSLDDRKQNQCFAAYVKIIEQMSTIDAQVLIALHAYRHDPIAFITLKYSFIDNNNEEITYAAEKYFTEDLKLPYETNEISASLANLDRLGLITLSSRYMLPPKEYQHIWGSSRVKKEAEMIKTSLANVKNLKISVNYSGLMEFSDFALGFAKICLQ